MVAAEPEVRFKPHPGQKAVWLSDARYKAMISGTGSGKTYFAPRYVYSKLRERGDGAVWLAASPTYRMGQRILIPAYTEFLVDQLGIAKFHKADAYFEIRDDLGRYTINMASADNPLSMEGQHVDGVHLDEGGMMALMALEVSQRRIGFRLGELLVTSTPYFINWLKTIMLDRYLAGDPDYHVSTFPSTMNPYYPAEEMERAQRSLSPARFAMMYEGRFERPEGLIYPDWADSMLVDPFTIPADWTRLGGLDWGWNNPTAGVLGAVSPDDVLYLYAEYYQPERTIQAHSEALSVLSGDGDVVWYSDPSARAEAEQARDYGLYTEPAMNDVLAGISEVTARIRKGQLKVFRGMVNWLDEMASYRWAVKAGTEDRTEKPVKEHDHLMDATRYLCAALPGADAPIIRFV